MGYELPPRLLRLAKEIGAEIPLPPLEPRPSRLRLVYGRLAAALARLRSEPGAEMKTGQVR